MGTQASQFLTRLFKSDHIISIDKLLLVIGIVAILLRLLSAFIQGNTVTVLPGIYDQISYDSLARRLADGYGFSFAEQHWPITRAGEPTAHWSFLYTAYLAALYSLFGPQPLLARLMQAVVVGGLHTYVIYRIGEKTFSRNVGIISAVISAFYIYFIYYTGALMTEPFYITAILCSLLFALHLGEDVSKSMEGKLGIALGVALGVTVLLRQVFLLFLPFLIAWIWIARFRRSLRLPVISTLLALGLVVLFIVPVTAYNQSRFGRFVLLNTNSGYAFFWGNHPIYGTHFYSILPAKLGTYQDLIPVETRHLDEAALDQELLKRGLQFVIDDPKRYILLSLSRIPVYFEFLPSSESGMLSNLSRVGSFGIALPFMLYGLFLAVRKIWSEPGNPVVNLFVSSPGLLILFALIYTAIHLLTWALIRYRLPVDAVLIPFAALGVLDIYSLLRKRNVFRQVQ